jgi:hypothetical protein
MSPVDIRRRELERLIGQHMIDKAKNKSSEELEVFSTEELVEDFYQMIFEDYNESQKK